MSRLDLDLTQPRTIPEILGATGRIYLGYAWLVLLLAAVVVVPYQVIVAVITHTAELGNKSSSSDSTILILAAAQLLIVQPLVASLFAHALTSIGEGRAPQLTEIARRTSKVLLNVIAAEIIAGICIFIGFFVFIIPGVILWLRLFVVAQVAAIEGANWPTAIRRSLLLTRGNWFRILGVVLVGGLINVTVDTVAGVIIGSGNGVAEVAVAAICAVLTLSFSSLLAAILYFDLRARERGQSSGF